MRDILFRGKRADNGEWAYGYYCKATRHWHKYGIHNDWIITSAFQNGGFFNVMQRYAVIPETVGMWTGLTDKNGKEIWEGDKVKDNYGNKGFVFYSEHFSRWQIRFTSGRDNLVKYGDIGVHIFDWIYPKIELEVIGNINDKEEV